MRNFWARGLTGRESGLLFAGLSLFAAILIRPFIEYNVDVASLTAFAERFLAGERIYIDMIEINPPGAFLLYVPAVLLGHAFGIYPEIMADLLVFLLIIGSLTLCHFMLAKSKLLEARHAPWLAVVAILILAIMPTRNFAQREHIGAIALLPLFSWMAARCAGVRISGWPTVLAGFGLCLALMCKPHFILAIVPPSAYFAWRTRSIKSLFDTPFLVGGALTFAYLLSVIVFFRAYVTDVMPMMWLIYSPNRRNLDILASVPSFTLWILPVVFVAASFAAGNAKKQETVPILLLASLGMVAAYFIQGKGWPYHAYPALVLVLLAASQLLIARPLAQKFNVGGKCLAGSAVLSIIVIAALWLNFDTPRYTRELAASLSKISPTLKIAYIGNEAGDIYPLARLIGGELVAGAATLGLTRFALVRQRTEKDPERIAKLQAYIERDHDMFLEDVRAGKPDIVLLQSEFWPQWVEKTPDMKKFLSNFERVETIGGIIIMKRC